MAAQPMLYRRHRKWLRNLCRPKEIPSQFTGWRSKPVHTMEIQAGSHNGDPSRFTQRRSKLVHTMEIQAGSHNGDPSWFTQWRPKLVHTMEIQAGSHNKIQAGLRDGGTSRFTQRRSKPVHKMAKWGTNSELAHAWGDWLHYPCRLGVPTA